MIHFYENLAAWWPLFAAPAEYAPRSAFYQRVLRDAMKRPARTMLDLGCGGGNVASFLKAHLEVTLTDLSPAMLDVSRRLNPTCRHIVGDMRDMRLGETFDFVFAQDSIAHLLTADDLAKAIHTAAAHCADGGVVLFAPDHTRENYRPMSESGGLDTEDGERGLRYLVWSQPLTPDADTYQADYVYILREGDEVEVVHEHNREGVFPRAFWLKTIAEAGLEAEIIPYEDADWPPGTHEIILCRKID